MLSLDSGVSDAFVPSPGITTCLLCQVQKVYLQGFSSGVPDPRPLAPSLHCSLPWTSREIIAFPIGRWTNYRVSDFYSSQHVLAGGFEVVRGPANLDLLVTKTSVRGRDRKGCVHSSSLVPPLWTIQMLSADRAN